MMYALIGNHTMFARILTKADGPEKTFTAVDKKLFIKSEQTVPDPLRTH